MNWGSDRRTPPARAAAVLSALLIFSCALIAIESFALASPGSASHTSTPAVSLTPASRLYNGESVTVSMAANAFFASAGGQALHVAECADPGGAASALPTSYDYCDGDTSTRVVAQPNGSFELSFTIYATPIAGYEPKDSVPDCNSRKYCVLLVGENLNRLSEHHLFSAPFLVATDAKSAASTTVSTALPATTAPGPSTSTVAPSTSSPTKLASGTLAGGSSSAAPWLAGVAGLVVVLGGALVVWRTRVRARR